MDTCCYHHYETCKKCGSSNLEKIKTEPVKVGRLIDHKLSFRCKDCGEITVIGVKEM